jgi:hypothetical protein
MAHDGLCGRCGAPLPRDERATCAYCGVTTGDAPAISPAQLAERSLRTIEAFKGTIANGADPALAISVAAREHLGPLGETDALARVVMAIVRDFERETGAKITSEPMAMSRVLDGYLKAVDAMRADGHAELDLPFLTATAQGPHHLRRRLDPGTVRALLEGGAQEPARPRRWWQLW